MNVENRNLPNLHMSCLCIFKRNSVYLQNSELLDLEGSLRSSLLLKTPPDPAAVLAGGAGSACGNDDDNTETLQSTLQFIRGWAFFFF